METLTRDKWNKTNEAIDKISALGYKVDKVKDNELHFTFKNKTIIYYPKKEWATGASIKDCRGLGKLLQQIKPEGYLVEVVTVAEIKEKLIELISDAREKAENTTVEEMYMRFDASADAFQHILDFINGEQ